MQTTLSKTIKGKTIFLKSFHKGIIETTEERTEAKQFESKEAANKYARQDLSTLTWSANERH